MHIAIDAYGEQRAQNDVKIDKERLVSMMTGLDDNYKDCRRGSARSSW